MSLPTFAGAWRHQWTWLLAGIALSFLIPFVFTDLISIDRDLYYGLYVGSVFTFVGLWLRFGIDSPRELLLHNWRRGVVLGVAFIGVMAAVVFKDPATFASPSRSTRGVTGDESVVQRNESSARH